jgi:hypothetical protein
LTVGGKTKTPGSSVGGKITPLSWGKNNPLLAVGEKNKTPGWTLDFGWFFILADILLADILLVDILMIPPFFSKLSLPF